MFSFCLLMCVCMHAKQAVYKQNAKCLPNVTEKGGGGGVEEREGREGRGG